MYLVENENRDKLMSPWSLSYTYIVLPQTIIPSDYHMIITWNTSDWCTQNLVKTGCTEEKLKQF